MTMKVRKKDDWGKEKRERGGEGERGREGEREGGGEEREREGVGGRENTI